MSIILKGNNSTEQKEKFPVDNVSNVNINLSTNGVVNITWTNPSNIVIDGTVVAQFDHVVIVIKKKSAGSAPSGINDGTSKSTSGTSTSFNIEQDVDYWVRFFTFSKEGMINEDSNCIYSFTQMGVSRILDENSWEVINKVAEAGKGQDYWKVGDEKTLVLGNGGANITGTYTVQIADFNHYDKADGSGKANIVFIFKNEYSTPLQINSNSINGWDKAKIRNNFLTLLYNATNEAKPFIKEVKTNTNAGNSYTKKQTTDKIFIPNYYEVLGKPLIDIMDYEGPNLPIFNDNDSRKRKSYWWLRTSDINEYDGFYTIGTDGRSNGIVTAGNSNYIVPVFNL